MIVLGSWSHQSLKRCLIQPRSYVFYINLDLKSQILRSEFLRAICLGMGSFQILFICNFWESRKWKFIQKEHFIRVSKKNSKADKL